MTAVNGDDVVTLVFLGWIGLGLMSGTGRRWARACRRAADRRHERRLELARARARTPGVTIIAEGGKPGRSPEPGANMGGCPHRSTVPVKTLDGKLVGWMCTAPTCRQRLPVTSAVLDTDLDGINTEHLGGGWVAGSGQVTTERYDGPPDG